MGVTAPRTTSSNKPLLVIEIEIKRALGDAGANSNVVEPRRLEPALGEHVSAASRMACLRAAGSIARARVALLRGGLADSIRGFRLAARFRVLLGI